MSIATSPALRYPKSLWSYNPLPTGCVLWIPFWASGLNSTAFKSVDTLRHTCAVTGATHEVDGRQFDGLDDVISVGDIGAPVFDGVNNKLSVIVWFNSDDTPVATEMLVTKYDDDVSPKKRTFILALQGTEKGQATAYLDGDIANNVGNVTNVAISTAGTWLCLGASIDLSAETIVIYTDGTVEASTKSTAGTPPTTFGDTDRNLTIGRAHNDEFRFDGRIGEVWMGNFILIAEGFDYYFQRTKGRYL